MNSRAINGRVLALIAVFGLAAGNAMSDPATQPEQAGQAGSQAASTEKQPELTPSQLIAQDFRAIAQEHATVGVATPKKDQGKR